MGQIAVYRCRDCGTRFEAHAGGGFYFQQYRCVDCDAVLVTGRSRTRQTRDYVHRCRRCGGLMQEEIKPMCPRCRSRRVKTVQTLACYD